MTDVDFFIGALNRLKESLGVSKDKQVAEALGLSDKALNARKSRRSFPETELHALSSRRPELKLDVTYILTGQRVQDWEREVLAQTAKTIAEMEPDPDGKLHQKLGKAVLATGAQKAARRPKYDALEMVCDSCTDEDFALLMSTTLALARRLAMGRSALPPAVTVKKAVKTAA